jgi:hypothetical protein
MNLHNVFYKLKFLLFLKQCREEQYPEGHAKMWTLGIKMEDIHEKKPLCVY